MISVLILYGDLIQKNSSKYTYELNSMPPSEFDISFSGLGDSLSEEVESGTLLVVDTDYYIETPSFVVSPVEKLYVEGDLGLVCPAYGEEKSKIRGDLSVFNQCFNDGSALDGSEICIESFRFGDSDYLKDRSIAPSFVLKDTEGVSYGQSFDPVRCFTQDSNLLHSGGDFYNIMRSISTYNGGRLFFGATAGEFPATTDVHIDVVYNYSDDQLASPGDSVDLFRWRLIDEDNVIVYTPDPSQFSKPDIDATPALYGSRTESLSKGRYALRLDVYLEATPSKPASMRVNVHLGSNTSGPIIATGFCEAMVGDNEQAKRSVMWCNFDLKPTDADLICWVHEPSLGTISKFEDTSTHIDLTTKSLGAIQIGETDFVLFYMKYGDGSLNDLNRVIYYKSLSLISGYGSEGSLRVHRDVYSFDVSLYKGDLILFFSDVDFNDRRGYPFVSNTPPNYTVSSNKCFSPSGLEVINRYQIDLTNIIFDGSDYEVSNSVILKDWSLISLSDLRQLLSQVVYNSLQSIDEDDDPRWYNQVGVSSLRVSYDEDRDVHLIACLEANSRLPFILMGRDSEFKLISTPFHFDIYNNWPFSKVLFDRVNFKIDSFDCSFGFDAMIYSISSRGAVSELGVIDPDFYWSAETSLIDKTYQYTNSDVFYRPEFKFKSITSMGLGISYEVDRILDVSIDRQDNYLVLNQSADEDFLIPFTWISGYPDANPFEVPSEMVWLPPMNLTHPTYSYTATNATDKLTLTQLVSGEFVKGVLGVSSTYRFKYDLYDTGYRFHARIKTTGNYTYPLEFYALAQTGESPDYLAGEARWLLDGNTATAQVYNQKTSFWDTVGSVSEVDDRILDYYILIQKRDNVDDLFQAAFFIKEFDHVLQNESGVHNLDFRQPLGISFKQLTCNGDVEYSTPETEFGVYFRTAAVDHLDQEAFVYQLDYTSLKADEGWFREADVSKDGNPIVEFIPEEIDGKDYREFDDSVLFNSSSLNYTFRTFKFNEDYLSPYIHWYNGFRFSYSGNNSYPDDSWSLKRETANDIQAVLSNRLHGLFSCGSEEDLIIWADANDSGLSVFNADTFIAKGVNCRDIEVVVKDLIEDPWVVIGSVELDKFQIISPEYTTSPDFNTVKVQLPSLRFHYGSLSSCDHYYMPLDYTEPVGKVQNADSNYLTVFKEDISDFQDSGVVFSSRGFLKLDQFVQHRFIGFRFVSKPFGHRYEVHSLDFGLMSKQDICFHHETGGINYQLQSKVNYLMDNQGFSDLNRQVVPSVSLNYNLVDASSYLRVLSMVENLNLDSKPVWVIDDKKSSSDTLFLCLLNNNVSHKTIKDDKSGKVRKYSISLNLVGVGE